MTLTPLKKAVIETEYKIILETLQQTNFNKTKAGKILGIDRTSINNKVKRYKQLQAQEAKKSIPEASVK
jgi:two-component system response regulator HydG